LRLNYHRLFRILVDKELKEHVEEAGKRAKVSWEKEKRKKKE